MTSYKLVELELSKPLVPFTLEPEQNGCGVIARWQDQLIGFEMLALPYGGAITTTMLAAIADEFFASRVLAAKTDDELAVRMFAPPLPRLSVAICTRDRAVRLARLLASLTSMCTAAEFPTIETIVVDNASIDDRTRQAVARFTNVRYVFEPNAGLNYARNAALRTAAGDILAYLDDDVVVDRHWLGGLAKAWRSSPNAGGFTGLVLPLRLDTEAQVYFERRGGFGRGFSRREFRKSSFNNPLFPTGAGILGAGCNMAFDRKLLIELGGFDEELDTGAPLPGGGDLDIFYRVLRAGRTMVYEPCYAVYHEHRETIAGLRRQYWSWGLGMMAFLAKSWRSDTEMREQHRGMVRWWFLDQMKSIACAILHRRGQELRFRLAELWGGVMGLLR